RSINGTVASASAQTTAPGPAAPAPTEKPKWSIEHTPPPVTGLKVGASHHAASRHRRRPGRFAVPVVYFFATWSSLVHNLGASDQLAFLFLYKKGRKHEERHPPHRVDTIDCARRRMGHRAERAAGLC